MVADQELNVKVIIVRPVVDPMTKAVNDGQNALARHPPGENALARVAAS